MTSIRCIRCQSEDLRYVPHAYQSGMVHSSGTHVTSGAAFTKDGVVPGFAVTNSSSVSMSQATRRLAPPSGLVFSGTELFGGLVKTAGIVGFLLSAGVLIMPFTKFGKMELRTREVEWWMPVVVYSIAFIGVFTPSLIMYILGSKIHRKGDKKLNQRVAQREREIAAWQNSWVCNRCGHIMVVP